MSSTQLGYYLTMHSDHWFLAIIVNPMQLLPMSAPAESESRAWGTVYGFHKGAEYSIDAKGGSVAPGEGLGVVYTGYEELRIGRVYIDQTAVSPQAIAPSTTRSIPSSVSTVSTEIPSPVPWVDDLQAPKPQPGSRQLRGETVFQFLARQDKLRCSHIAAETDEAREKRTSREDEQSSQPLPRQKGSVKVWKWEEDPNGYWERSIVGKGKYRSVWDETNEQNRKYNSIHNEYDVCVGEVINPTGNNAPTVAEEMINLDGGDSDEEAYEACFKQTTFTVDDPGFLSRCEEQILFVTMH